MLQCAVCRSVLQCVAVCCSALKSEMSCSAMASSRQDLCCSVLQCVAVCCSVLQCVAVCCSALRCVAVCGKSHVYAPRQHTLYHAHTHTHTHTHTHRGLNLFQTTAIHIGGDKSGGVWQSESPRCMAAILKCRMT